MTIDPQSILSRFENVTGGDGGQYEARCPVHDDSNNSLAINVSGQKILLHCHANCKLDEILKAVELTKADLFLSNGSANGSAIGSAKRKSGKGKIVAEYNYRDEDGEILFQAVRFDPKDFRQRRKLNGKWVWSLGDVRRVLFRSEKLSTFPKPSPIIFVEGEKDVIAAEKLDFKATCNPMGAGKWIDSYSQQLSGHNVAIIADNDDPGREHALHVAQSLHGIAASVRVIYLPGLPNKGDLSDWIADGGTAEQLIEIIRATAKFEPSEKPATSSSSVSEKPSAIIYKSVAPGTLVNASDRGDINTGTVESDNGDSCTVHFRSPEGVEATKDIDKIYLSLLDGTPLVESPDNAPIKPIQASSLLLSHPHLREIVIDGLARIGETINIVSVTKIGKSWLAYSLLMAIATEQKWLGTFDCKQGRCLLIDNELHVETIARRLDTVAKAMGIPAYEWGDQIDIVSLRGKMVDLNALAPTILAIKPGTYQIVLADAWYRFFPPGVDENSNAQVMQLYNRIDQYADHLQSVWVNIHHASKGNQSSKSVVDVGSGAGSQSRAADSHLILRPHREDKAVVMEAAVRSFPPLEPLALRWNWPVWELADDLNAADLKSERGQKGNRAADVEAMKTNILETFIHFPDGATKTDIRSRVGQGKVFDTAWLSVCNGGDVVECEILKANNRTFSGFKRVYKSDDSDF
jgi:hypothetical protein